MKAASWNFTTADQLREAGYAFLGRGMCQGAHCREVFGWWTTPAGKRMPIDLGTFKPHWSTCPDSKSFHRDKRKKKEVTP